MAATLSDIQLNIIVNVRNAASLAALSSTLNSITSRQAAMAKSASASASATQKQAAAFGSLKGRLDNVEQKYDAMFRASYRLMNVGYQLIGVSKAMIGAIKGAADAWGKFEFTLNRAAGALQVWKDDVGGINPLYEALIQNVLSASKELRLFPAEEVAKATYFWGSTTGQTVRTMQDLEVVMGAINPLMKVAALTQTSYEAAIKGTYSIIVQYGKSLTDVEDVTAKLFLATQRTALEFGDLINSFKYVGPTAHALGISFEEVAQVLGALGDAGLRGSMSGRGLRQMLIRLVKPPKEAAKALNALFMNTESLGKSFDELAFPNGKFIGLTGYVGLLAEALKNATGFQRNQLYALVSTANELPVLTSLVENQIKVLNKQSDAYDMSKSSVSDSANAALQFKRNWDLLSDSWVGLTGRLERGAEVIKIQVGRVFAGSLRTAVQSVTDFLDRVERWVRRNPDLVKSLGQLSTTIAIVTGAFGALALSAGALLGLRAAIGVIGEAFGPLAGAAGATLGSLILLAEAVIDNWTRIQRVIVPALNKFVVALTGGTDGIAGVAKAWTDIHSSMKGVVDLIVKQAINALKMVLDVLTMIAESPIRPFLDAIAKALVLAFGLKTLAYIVGFGTALSTFFKVLMIAKAGAIGTAIQLRLMGVSAIFASGSVKGLTLALQTMSKTTVLLLLTLIVAGFELLRDMLPKTGQNLEDLRGEMDDFYFTLGDSASQWLDRTLDATSGAGTAFKKLAAELAAMEAQGARDPFAAALEDAGNYGASAGLSELRAQVAAQETVWLNLKKTVKTSWESIAADTDRSVSDIEGFVRRFGTSLFGDLSKNQNMDKASAAARAYFEALKDGTELTTASAVEMWNNLIGMGVKMPSDAQSKETFLKLFLSKEEIERHGAEVIAAAELTKAKIALTAGKWSMGFEILNGLRADADKYGPEFNATVTKMLGEIPKTTAQIMEEAVGLLSATPKEMLDAFTAAFKNLGSLHEQFLAAQENKITAKEVAKAFLGDLTSSDLITAFKKTSGMTMNLWAEGALDTIHDSWTTAVTTYEATGNSAALRTALTASFTATFGAGSIAKIISGTFQSTAWLALPVAMQVELQQMANWIAEGVGNTTPAPSVVTAAQNRWAGKIAAMFRADITEAPAPPAVDPLADVVAQMQNSAATGKTTIDNFKTSITNALSGWTVGGINPIVEWAGGIISGFQSDVVPAVDVVTNHMKNHLMGSSPPPLGPLANIVTGGRNVIQSWAYGILAGLGTVATVILQVTGTVKALLTISLFQGGYKTIKSWVAGMYYYWLFYGKKIVNTMTAYVRNHMAGNSPPPMGNLKNIDTGGYNIVKAWAQGIEAGGGLAEAAAQRTAMRVNSALGVGGLNGGQPISFASSNERLIKVQVDVSSKDGSVNQLDIGVLSESLIPELVRSLEQMASVAN